MEIIQNEVVSLSTAEKVEIANIFTNIIVNIKNDITNQ